MRVLIAEEDPALASFVRKGLEAEHYAVDVSPDGEQVRSLATELAYDLLILDLNLARVDGVTILRHLRTRKPSMPILVLTSRNRVEDRVECLDLGADDFLSMPFSFSELSARIRTPAAKPSAGSFGAQRHRSETQQLTCCESKIPITISLSCVGNVIEPGLSAQQVQAPTRNLTEGHIDSGTEVPFKFGRVGREKSSANLMTVVNYLSCSAGLPSAGLTLIRDSALQDKDLVGLFRKIFLLIEGLHGHGRRRARRRPRRRPRA